MLHNNVIEQRNGFRPLSSSELLAVCGGLEIVVTGNQIVVTGERSGGLSGLDMLAFQDMQQAAAIQQMIDMMQGTTEEAPPPEEEWTPAGLFDSDLDDFSAFIDQQFPNATDVITVVGDVGGTKIAVALSMTTGDGYIYQVTDNTFVSDTYDFMGFAENLQFTMGSSSSTQGSTTLTMSFGGGQSGGITFDVTQDSPDW